jgi:demethylmenaquinone methyltransferase/2-methoxy-6-polyprenyl-1,4-benzoquinol methylase
VNVSNGERVLDVGCGTGRALVQLAASTPEGWTDGLDATPAMVVRARARLASLPHDRFRIRRGRAQNLPYPDDAFDAVFSSYVVDVLPRPATTTALSEMRRVVRPEGRLVLVVLIPPVRLSGRLWSLLARWAPLLLGGGRPIRPRPLLRQAGFSIEKTDARTQMGLRSGILQASPR